MGVRESINSEEYSVWASALGALKAVAGSLPAIIQKASDGHTAVAQSTIQGSFTDYDTGKVTYGPIAQFADMSVHFHGGGGTTHTHPVAVGDEGIVHFMSRAYDTWWQNGGTNNNPIDSRMHSHADGMWVGGVRSNPRKLNPAPSTSSDQVRSDDGKHVRDTHPQNGLTSASTVKHLIVVANSTGTLHGPQNIIKNAIQNVLIQTVTAAGVPPPGQLTIANRKLVATMPLPVSGSLAGAMSSIMSSVLSGGSSAIFTNPTAAANTILSSAASSGAAALTSALGGSAATMVAAMTGGSGLTSALSSLTTGTNSMAGVTTPSGGNFGLSDVISHLENATAFFGATPPASVAPATVLAPLQAAPMLSQSEASLSALVQSVINGVVSVASGTAQVQSMTTQISALLPAANAAISTLQTAAPVLKNALAVATATLSQDPNLASLGNALAAASPPLASLAAGALAIITPSAGDLAAASSFPDSSADQTGAQGGVE